MCRGLKAADRRASLDAAWILTNVAAGEHATAAAALAAGPALVSHLGAGLGLGMAQQCAWALGEPAAACLHMPFTFQWGPSFEHQGRLSAAL